MYLEENKESIYPIDKVGLDNIIQSIKKVTGVKRIKDIRARVYGILKS